MSRGRVLFQAWIDQSRNDDRADRLQEEERTMTGQSRQPAEIGRCLNKLIAEAGAAAPRSALVVDEIDREYRYLAEDRKRPGP
jgi:hypothetical protein